MYSYIVALSLLMVTHLSYSCEIRVRVTDGYQPPRFQQDQSGRWSGYSYETMMALLDSAGCTPVLVKLPFARALLYLQDGNIDLVLGLTFTEERDKTIDFIGPQYIERIVLVVNKSSDYIINDLRDLADLPLKIGKERAYYYGDQIATLLIEDSVFANSFITLDNIDQLPLMLNSGRISGFLLNESDARKAINTNPLFKNLRLHPFIINETPVYFGFSRKSLSEEERSRLREAYKDAESEIKDIWRRYRGE